MKNKLKVYLFSRDRRTHQLFRGAWENSVKTLDRIPVTTLRFENPFGLLGSMISFVSKYRSQRLIFGSSEILLYAIFSSKKDYWVFTGLGRLLDGKDSFLQKVLFQFLRVVHSNQKLIVLNQDDKRVVESYLKTAVFLLPGEGYKFNLDRGKGSARTSGISYAYIGRLLHSKGVEIILRAFTRSSMREDILYLYGDFDFGNNDSIKEEIISYYNSISEGSISVKGFVDNLQSELLSIDTVVSMSRREGLPFAVLDAINCGCNLILSDVPGHREFKHLDGVDLIGSEEELVDVFKNQRDNLRRLSITRDVQRIEMVKDQFGYSFIQSLIIQYIK